jgi:hypothetical protein
MDTLNDNSSVLCIHGIQSLLQRDEVNNGVNILYFMVERAGAKLRQSGGNHKGNRHWIDEECTESKWKSRKALRVFKENNDEVSRIKYWESTKTYVRVVVKKKAAWQMEEEERINILVRHKEARNIWEVIRTIVKKMDLKNDVNPCDWVKYFDLYARKSNSGLVYETQLLGPQCIEELDSDFTKEGIRGSTRVDVALADIACGGRDKMGGVHASLMYSLPNNIVLSVSKSVSFAVLKKYLLQF